MEGCTWMGPALFGSNKYRIGSDAGLSGFAKSPKDFGAGLFLS